MKIYSFNLLFENTDFDRVLAFISGLDFDILTLQEVPEHFLAKLKQLPHHFACSSDGDMVDASGAINRIYLVTLSRFPLLRQNAVIYQNDWYPDPAPVRSRVFRRMFAWTYRHPLENRSALWVDVELPGSVVLRVFNVHLGLVFPKTRYAEFDLIAREVPKDMPTVICGDFNILELPHITVLNWIFGGSFGDFVVWWRERKLFEKKFAELGLVNPLKGSRTHRIAYSQLDHILVSDTIRCEAHQMISDTVGSDHHPVMVEIVP